MEGIKFPDFYKPEIHIKEIDEAIKALFDSKLMKIDPFSMSDSEIMQFIRRKESGDQTTINEPYSFCTVTKIKEICPDEYKGKSYEAIVFDNPKIHHNMSDFRYGLFPVIDPSKILSARCLAYGLPCNITGTNGRTLSPDDVIGKELLLAYNYEARNSYGKKRKRDRFYVLDELTPDDIRNLIMQAQHAILSYLHFFPGAYSTQAMHMNGYGYSGQSIKTFVERITGIHSKTITDAYNKHCKSMDNHGIKFHLSKLFPGNNIRVIEIHARL